MSKETEYKFPVQLKGGTNIELIMNRILRSLTTAHILFAPRSFKYRSKKTEKTFYSLCLFGIYAESLVSTLNKWREYLNEYFNEFEGSWKYYASYKRIESIRQDGGEDSDYDGDGNVIQVVGDEILVSDSIVSHLIQGCIDIVQDTKFNDLKDIYAYIQIDSAMSMDDVMIAIVGKTIPSYRQDKNGNMLEITWAEKQINKVEESIKGETLTAWLMAIVCVVRGIVIRLRSLPKNQDNATELREIQDDIQKLIDFELWGLKKYYIEDNVKK